MLTSACGKLAAMILITFFGALSPQSARTYFCPFKNKAQKTYNSSTSEIREWGGGESEVVVMAWDPCVGGQLCDTVIVLHISCLEISGLWLLGRGRKRSVKEYESLATFLL